MKHLLYYNVNSQFVSDQVACGGDGSRVVSVVDGVSWSKDNEVTHYRLANNDSENLTSYTITVHSINSAGTKVDSDSLIEVSCYKGKTVKEVVYPVNVPGYTSSAAPVSVIVSGNTEVTFEYYRNNESLLNTPLTIEFLSGGTFSVRSSSRYFTTEFNYSINGGEWIGATATTSDYPVITVNAGDKMRVRGGSESTMWYRYTVNPTDGVVYRHSRFYSLPKCKVYGNIASLETNKDLSEVTDPSINVYGLFRGNGVISAGGLIIPSKVYSIMYMFCGDGDLEVAPELPATEIRSDAYRALFAGCTKITDAPALPGTSLSASAYFEMFSGCTSLTGVPQDYLPATTLADSCYTNMFADCTSLTSAPDLPATILKGACYYGMFQGCTGLTKAPDLPATKLYPSCYEKLFSGCTSLNYIKCLASGSSMSNYTLGWVTNVASAGTFVKNIMMTGWTRGTYGIPTNWTVNDAHECRPLTFKIISAGTLYWLTDTTGTQKLIRYSKNGGNSWTNILSDRSRPGTAINVSVGDTIMFVGNNDSYGVDTGNYNYFSTSGNCAFNISGNIMSLISSGDFATLKTLNSEAAFLGLFWGCRGVRSAKNLLLPATGLTKNCYNRMFCGCSYLTETPDSLPATIMAENCYVGMFSSCTSLQAFQTELPATTLATYCYGCMFSHCTELATVISALPATTMARQCYQGMFQDCWSLTTAPELPALTLLQSSYAYMFQRAYNLNYIKCLAIERDAFRSTEYWMDDVQTNSGTFIKHPDTTWNRGITGIPNNWTVQDATL